MMIFYRFSVVKNDCLLKHDDPSLTGSLTGINAGHYSRAFSYNKMMILQ